MKEAILEPLLRELRLRSIRRLMKNISGRRLLDVGCGKDGALLTALSDEVEYCAGIDRVAIPQSTENKVIVRGDLTEVLPFADDSFDVVTLLAVLEHIENADRLLHECARVLNHNGYLMLTVPSWAAKPVLEFLAFRLGVVSAAQIADHKRYYWKSDIVVQFDRIAGFELVEHRYFQLGFNNLAIARAIKTSKQNLEPDTSSDLRETDCESKSSIRRY